MRQVDIEPSTWEWKDVVRPGRMTLEGPFGGIWHCSITTGGTILSGIASMEEDETALYGYCTRNDEKGSKERHETDFRFELSRANQGYISWAEAGTSDYGIRTKWLKVQIDQQ